MVLLDGAISPLNLDILASKRQLAPLLNWEGASFQIESTMNLTIKASLRDI